MAVQTKVPKYALVNTRSFNEKKEHLLMFLSSIHKMLN